MNERDLQLPAFDARAARRAIRRGIARTVLATLAVLLVVYLGFQIASALWHNRPVNRDRIQDVLGRGLLVAHPGFSSDTGGCCNTSGSRTELVLGLTPRVAGSLEQEIDVRLQVGLGGHLVRETIPELPETPVEQALQVPRAPSKAATRRVLGRLPEGIIATALVGLRTPLRNDAWERFLVEHGSTPTTAGFFADVPPVFVEPLYRPRSDIRGWVLPLSWPGAGAFPMDAALSGRAVHASGSRRTGPLLGDADDDSLAQFAAWTRRLDEDDEHDLRLLGLPSVAGIKRVGRNPKVHGFIVERAPLSRVRRYLDDPQVSSVKVVDVAFDLELDGEG